MHVLGHRKIAGKKLVKQFKIQQCNTKDYSINQEKTGAEGKEHMG